MITRRAIKEAFEKNVMRLIPSPHSDGIVCQAGSPIPTDERWFYFGGQTAEEYSDINLYVTAVGTDTIIAEIYSTLTDFWYSSENKDEYALYECILNEAGIETLNLKWFAADDNLPKYKDSMLFDSHEDIIAKGIFSYKGHYYTIKLEVNGEVAVSYKGITYHRPSEFPEELRELIDSHPNSWDVYSPSGEGNDDEEGDIYVGLNNWFEYLCYSNGHTCDGGCVYENDLSKANADDILADMYEIAEQYFNDCTSTVEKNDKTQVIPLTTLNVETYINDATGKAEIFIEAENSGTGVHYPVASIDEIGEKISEYLADMEV